MSKFVSSVIKETINKKRPTINLFEAVLIECEKFFMGLDEAKYHEKSLAGENVINIKRLSKKQKEYCLDLIKSEGQSIVFIFDILEELGTALRGLIIGDYRGVSRSLRLALEFLVFWADFEGDGRTGVDAYGEYSRQKLTNDDFLHFFNELRTIRHTRIKERLIIKEKQRQQRSFQEMTKGVSILSGKKGEEYLFRTEQVEKIQKIGIEEKLTKRTHIRDKIDGLYSYLSAFSHVTFTTLQSLADWEAWEGFRNRDAIYYAYSYSEEPFTICSDNLWEVIDLVIVTVILEKS